MERLKERLKLSTAAWGLSTLLLIPVGKISYDSAMILRELNHAHKQEVQSVYPDLDWNYVLFSSGVDRYIPFRNACYRKIRYEEREIVEGGLEYVEGFIMGYDIVCRKPKNIEAQVKLLNQISRRDDSRRREGELGFTLPIVSAMIGLMVGLILWEDKRRRITPLSSWMDFLKSLKSLDSLDNPH